MNDWNSVIKRKVRNENYPVLTRIKVGRGLFFIANLPIGTSPLYLIAIPMMMRNSLSTIIKGKLNRMRGNGDLRW